jgi:hypothetical protein
MPTDQAEAVVLRTMNIGDQDKIAVFFCRDKGVIRGVAKGARKFGNRFGSSLEPMSVVRVFYYEKERRDLITVSGCDLIESFFEVQAEPDTAFLLTYFAELSGSRKCRQPLAPGWLAPKRDGAYCGDCAPFKKDPVPPAIREFLQWVRKNPPPGGCAPPFPADEIAAIRKTLQALIVYYMDREPRTLQFLKTK